MTYFEYAEKYGIGYYFILAGAIIAYAVGFISVFLVIGMLIYSLVKKNWSVWRKWKYVGYLILVAMGLAVLGYMMVGEHLEKRIKRNIAASKSVNTSSSPVAPATLSPEPAQPVITEPPPSSMLTLTPQEPNKTVLDYYYELPQSYFMGDPDYPFTREEREQAITVKDTANYYIEFSSPHVDGNGSVTVFVTLQKTHLVAVETKGCGPACEQKFYFLTYRDGVWKDVTTDVFPNISSKIAFFVSKLQLYLQNRNPDDFPLGNFLIRLPQHGTTIEYYDQFSEIILLKLRWRQGKFIEEKIPLEGQNPAWERKE